MTVFIADELLHYLEISEICEYELGNPFQSAEEIIRSESIIHANGQSFPVNQLHIMLP